MSIRCSGITKSGARCKCKTRKTNLCWIHLKKTKNLRVKPSNIAGAGFGLYATKDFKKKEKVAEYKGLTKRRKPSGHYGLQVKRNPPKYIDAKNPHSCSGRYCNTCRKRNKDAGECRGNNAKFAISHRNNQTTVNIKATKKIRTNDEIFIPYGSGFRV